MGRRGVPGVKDKVSLYEMGSSLKNSYFFWDTLYNYQ